MSNELHEAIKQKKSVEELTLIIKKKLELEKNRLLIKGPLAEYDEEGLTPLQVAAKENNLQALILLLDNGARPNVNSKSSDTALHYAAENNFTEIVSELIHRDKTIISLKNGKGKSALHLAAERGHEKTIELLIQNKAEPNVRTTIMSLTPAHLIAQNGHENLISCLNQWGMDFRLKDKDNKAPIDLAYEAGRVDVVELLKKIGSASPQFNVDLQQFFSVFGGSKKLPTLLDKDSANVFEGIGGNGVKESAFLRYYLEKFFDSRKEIDPQKIQKILNGLIYTKVKQLFDNRIDEKNLENLVNKLIEKGDAILISTGLIDHHIPARLEKIKDKVVLKLYDKGAFRGSELPNSNDKKVYCVRVLEFPDDKLDKIGDVVKLLLDRKDESREIAIDKLFFKIPELVDSKYVFSQDITQKPSKFTKCYLSNNHIVLLDLMVEAFGDSEGKNLYKEFTIFRRKEIAKDFKENSVEKKIDYPESFWKIFDKTTAQIILGKEERLRRN